MNYKVSITTLTPIHIGTGQDLLVKYDFKADEDQGQTYRLNVDTIFEENLTGNDQRLDHQLMSQEPSDLVSLEELRQQPRFSVYVLRGLPRTGQVKEQLKNVWGQLYLPGSSIKGALRTAIAYNIGNQIQGQLSVNYTKNTKNRAEKDAADDTIDQKLFGSNHQTRRNWINYDLLRALQVTDTRGVEASPELINVSVIKKGQPQAPIDVEAIPKGVTFATTIHLETYLYQNAAKVSQQPNGEWLAPSEQLGWEPERSKWLYNLPAAARNVIRRRFKEEIDYCQSVGLDHPAKIYAIWQKSLTTLKKTHIFYLQIGWAGGWDSKTYGRDLLARDQQGNYNNQQFAEIRQDFELGKPPRFKGKWQTNPDDTFPTSRRMYINKNGNLEPLGWVEVRLEKIQ